MADPRYLEAWKRNPQGMASSPVNKEKTAKSAAPASTLQVRLDTPGGLTYSPNEMTSHNLVKRLFIPYKMGEGGDERESGERGYDFDQDLEQERAGQEEGGVSAARAYALSIDFDALDQKRTRTLASAPTSATIDEEEGQQAKLESYGDDDDDDDKMSFSGQSRMSTSSQATMTTLSSKRQNGSLPDWYTRTAAHRDVAPFVVPPSQTGAAQDYKRPWDAMRWHGHRAFERPSERDKQRGISAFQDVNGIGRAPSLAETATDDAKSVVTVQTSNTTRQAARSLNVADLFVVDPRTSRPLRMVRRTDPRQVLLLCNGVHLGASQVMSIKAARAAKKAGIDLKDMSSNAQEAQKMLATLVSSAESRGGIGVVYCPHEDSLSQDEEKLAAIDARIDVNCAKRLEAPPTFTETTERRAQLRAAVAALELANWEEEGFDKIVIGVEQYWIVRGISNDIWRWKHTGWTLTDQSPQGSPGESVPDRDLWEVLDEAVQAYEKIDCNVRFWQVAPKDARLARKLAEIGTMKDKQRPGLVRWRRKRPAALQAAMEGAKNKNHQGPVLGQVT